MKDACLSASLRLLARATPYVESELLGLYRVVRPGDVCLDVGAALGIYTVVLSRLVGGAGTVHSVEPLPFAHPVLSAGLRPRRGPNIHRHTLALGPASGQGIVRVPLRASGAVTGRSFLSTDASGLGANREFDRHADVVVGTETLDGLCLSLGLDRLDFLKADIEGAELLVLASGEQTIERWRPALLLELEERHTRRYGYRPEDVVDWLSERGYRMREWRGGAWRPTGRVGDHRRNYLFLPECPCRS